MFKKFQDYMYYLLTSPMKKVSKSKNQWYILFRVLGKRLDEALESIYRAREETLVVSCSEELLEEQAAERGMTRYRDEGSESFRKRIANFQEVMKLSGTDEGVILAAQTLGYKNVAIRKAKDVTGDESRWAEFYLIVDVDLRKEFQSLENLKREVRRIKSVGAKDNYYFYYKAKANEVHDVRIRSKFRWGITFYSYRALDGKFLLNGGSSFDATKADYKVRYKKQGRVEEL